MAPRHGLNKAHSKRSITLVVKTAEKTLTHFVGRNLLISELKERLAQETGYPLEHQALSFDDSTILESRAVKGALLDDFLTLADYGIKNETTLHLSLCVKGGAKRKTLELGDVDDSDEEAEEEGAERGRKFPKSPCTMEKAKKNSLSRALTSGGLHANEESLPQNFSRENARKMAQLKAAAGCRGKQPKALPTGLLSVISQATDHLFPDLFGGWHCTPALAKPGVSGGRFSRPGSSGSLGGA